MTLQQLRYLIAIANHGSISAAAHTLYVSQSSLSVAVRDIERETGVTIFERSNRGITLTSDGIELLGYARQVVEQADLMEQRYSGRGGEAAQRLSITSQHYAFVVEAFLELAEEYEGAGYNFSLRETRTSEVIEDVRDFRSDLGAVSYTHLANARTIKEGLAAAGLEVYGADSSPYVWCRTPNGTGSWDFFNRLLEEANVITTPGAGFGPAGEGYIRLTAFGDEMCIRDRDGYGR